MMLRPHGGRVKQSRGAENGRGSILANVAGLITIDFDLAQVDNTLLRARRTDLSKLVFS